ncbi:MAG: hypothetical protein ACYTBV_19715 [Planctomycetota bacterium]|jgi:hypothetical protein
MIPRILLVNPPIYDFAAFDFWSRPYGLLSVAGFQEDSVSKEFKSRNVSKKSQDISGGSGDHKKNSRISWLNTNRHTLSSFRQ